MLTRGTSIEGRTDGILRAQAHVAADVRRLGAGKATRFAEAAKLCVCVRKHVRVVVAGLAEVSGFDFFVAFALSFRWGRFTIASKM